MRVFLVRHGEAEPGHELPDRARALTRAGRRQARALAHWLADRERRPTAARFSSARRAVETAAHVLPVLGIDADPRGDDALYLASASALLALLADSADASVLMIGHNPGMAELAVGLARRGDEDARRRMASRFPPAACAEIELPDGGRSAGELVAYWTP